MDTYFRNKTKFTVLVLYADTFEESEKLQNLLARYNFQWGGFEVGYFMNNIDISHYLYLVLKNSEILWCAHLDKAYLKSHTWNKKVYTIKDICSLKCMLQYGQELPSYQPKKIDRTL